MQCTVDVLFNSEEKKDALEEEVEEREENNHRE